MLRIIRTQGNRRRCSLKAAARRAMLLAAAAGAAAGIVEAQPALTTIQDVLYRADGSRFTGTMFIHWNSFQAQDTSNIATSNLTLQIVNGVLNVKLVPTTTATAGARYTITYSSRGTQFTETWAVPPSSLALRVRDVRVSQGTVVGPAPVISPVQIGDVVGLTNALAVRPTQGVGYAIGRAAVINQAGQIEAAAGSLADCVRVDGTSGPCGGNSGGVLPGFVDSEQPMGSLNGTNTYFTLAIAPSPGSSLALYRNGLLMKQGADYSLNGNAITFSAGSIPQAGDTLTASYRFANPNNPLGSLAMPQVVCSSTGTSTSATTPTQLGSCTIPAGLLGTGDRIEVQYRLDHSGTATGFTGQIFWGSTMLSSRAAAGSEPGLVARAGIQVYAGAQSYDVQNWGSTLAQQTSLGTATENTSASVTIAFVGSMAGSGSDSVTLRNFTVVRYPAQTNP